MIDFINTTHLLEAFTCADQNRYNTRISLDKQGFRIVVRSSEVPLALEVHKIVPYYVVAQGVSNALVHGIEAASYDIDKALEASK